MREQIYWRNPKYRKRPPLVGDVHYRYLIVGGGITGVS
jgi:hypothetical protein